MPETVIDQFVRHRLGALPGAGGYRGRAGAGCRRCRCSPAIVRARRRAQQETIDADDRGRALPAEWPLPRLDPVLRALLRAGGAELWMPGGPPARVVINEYLDVAHGFFEGEELRKLANGVLDRIAHLLRPAEFDCRSV
jgi:N utilization substance protein B